MNYYTDLIQYGGKQIKYDFTIKQKYVTFEYNINRYLNDELSIKDIKKEINQELIDKNVTASDRLINISEKYSIIREKLILKGLIKYNETQGETIKKNKSKIKKYIESIIEDITKKELSDILDFLELPKTFNFNPIKRFDIKIYYDNILITSSKYNQNDTLANIIAFIDKKY